MEKLKITITQAGEWYDVNSAWRTSPTSALEGTKRCSLDEIEEYVKFKIAPFIEEEKRAVHGS